MDLKKLQDTFPFHWKIQSFNKQKTKASCVAYIDARDVMNVLDHVVWPENWQDKYEKQWDVFFAGIWIKINDEWVWKWDTWTEAKTESEKSQFSDGFKRAWVKWWIGRFLYKQNIIWVNIDQYKNPLDKNWNKVPDLNEYCNKINDYFNSKKQ